MKNNIKRPLNSLIEIDKKILPFFSSPIILKRISDQKKNIDLNKLNPQKKLIYKIIKLNEKLVKFSTSIKQYNLNLDSFFLPAYPSKEDNKGLENIPAIHMHSHHAFKDGKGAVIHPLKAGGGGNKSEFILFVRNNLYYNLKFRWSNILYKIEKLIPVLKFHSLLNNINLFAPKRLLKPQPYIRFYYRIIKINNFAAYAKQQAPFEEQQHINLIPSLSAPTEVELPKAFLPVNEGGLKKANARLKTRVLRTQRSKVLIKINGYNDESSMLRSPIQLHKFENGKSIKYILKKLNTLLNEIDNIIFIKNILIKVLKIKNIKNLHPADLSIRSLKDSPNQILPTLQHTPLISESFAGQYQAEVVKDLSVGYAVAEQNEFTPENKSLKKQDLQSSDSNQSVKNLRLKIKKINSRLSAQSSYAKADNFFVGQQTLLRNNDFLSNAYAEKDIINENSNPVDLLYFNNNLQKPIINQYIKSMSTYNMITNGTILYYSNIIGFNFKKRIRAYLPFIKSVSASFPLREGQNGAGVAVKGGERLTSPYSIRSLRKVIGSLDQYKRQKFSIFGRGIENNKLINNIYKFLYLSFRSMYCLISKPVFIVKSNKIIIQLFYFVLIPKIFKHIKSKTNSEANILKNQSRTNKKRLYKKIIEKKKTQAFSTLYEGRLKVKEDAHRENYFALDSLPPLNEQQSFNNLTPNLIREVPDVWWLHRTKGVYDFSVGKNKNNNSNTSIMSLDDKSAQLLAQTYYNELKEIRKNEEKISGVKFDKFGLAKFKSVEIKRSTFTLKDVKAGQISKGGRNNNNLRLQSDAQSSDAKFKKRYYKIFLKRFGFNNMINDLHILRFPKKWCSYPSQLRTRWQRSEGSRVLPFQNISTLRNAAASQRASTLYNEQYYASGEKARRGINPKLFKYLALTYLNIFKFKSSHPLLNRLKFKLRWFKKELIEDYSYLLSYNNNLLLHQHAFEGGVGNAASHPQGQALNRGARLRTQRVERNNFKFNLFLFKKLFWSIRLSKLIIPNAKILQKLGIPKWRWPYSGLKKKGYPQLTASVQPTLSYSWPFSLLMSPTILQINNRINNSPSPAEGGKDKSISLRDGHIDAQSPAAPQPLLKEAALTKSKSVLRYKEGLVGGEVQVPVLQNRSRYKLRELYTRRHHLMKLANINLIKIYPLKFEKLCEVLNSIFNKPVELDLIRLHYPYNDSNILVRLLAFMINKMKFRRITRRLFNKAVVKSIKKINNKDQVNIIPAFISGITIKVAGRLMKYKVVPRKTVKIFRRGSSSIGKINYSDISRYTNKNKRGSFTITVKSGHNFFN